ncbi:Component of oligomeric Golgi complex 6 [Seminavis robusta]|uniref:Component of oligomeric Golgi complex 6 n=1 Tax=Seminavis robusta TaxID=568900 RepID=A0A9N8HFA6_9STRA|nr:Component of oligomeric Golgi complex 6 [Seminavis robusta]|eukprot:Sro559_g166470.1 Component of oligomeric Golgi complex 6 (183) ;mRNA; f:32486-33034
MDWLLSEPLLDAALAQISTLEQFASLESNFKVAEESGKDIPDSVRVKLGDKKQKLWVQLVQNETQSYMDKSGLGALVTAKQKWDDVHFMAEAHGVGSSIPMVSYTGLSQKELEDGMNLFYAYLASNKLSLTNPELQKQVAHAIAEAYKEVHETATGEFGGYDPFQSMVDHTPEKVRQIVEGV